MAERTLEFLSNLLKIGKEQLLLKGELLRNKVPIKSVLGLAGLGVFFMTLRPLFAGNKNSSPPRAEPPTSQPKSDKSEPRDEHEPKKTLYLIREKEKELTKPEMARQ